MSRQVAVLLLAAAAAGLAREPGFAEFRAVQEMLSLRAKHPRVGGLNAI